MSETTSHSPEVSQSTASPTCCGYGRWTKLLRGTTIGFALMAGGAFGALKVNPELVNYLSFIPEMSSGGCGAKTLTGGAGCCAEGAGCTEGAIASCASECASRDCSETACPLSGESKDGCPASSGESCPHASGNCPNSSKPAVNAEDESNPQVEESASEQVSGT